MDNNLEIFCVTNERLKLLENTKYKLAGVGKKDFPENYYLANTGDNIFSKEEFYSELTFHYWYWKNLLDVNKDEWVGFCQKRRFWKKINSLNNGEINQNNFFANLLIEPEKDWNNYDAIICKPIDISGSKRIKIIKRGWRNFLKNPKVLFDKKEHSIEFHFDLHHGYGNLYKAANLLEEKDRLPFIDFIRNNNCFNPHIMFISKPIIIDKYFSYLFKWLERCEKIFPKETLKGYDKKRMFAYLSERYLSYWFQNYTKFKEQPWFFFEI